jgi:hypothetical protein
MSTSIPEMFEAVRDLDSTSLIVVGRCKFEGLVMHSMGYDGYCILIRDCQSELTVSFTIPLLMHSYLHNHSFSSAMRHLKRHL